MKNKAWIDQVRKLSKEGKREEAVLVVRKVLEKDRFNYEALWIMANISTSHPERYAALKIYEELSHHWPLKHIDTARNMLIEYEQHSDLIGELERGTPQWSKDKETSSNPIKSILSFLFDVPYWSSSSDSTGCGCLIDIFILLVIYLVKLIGLLLKRG